MIMGLPVAIMHVGSLYAVAAAAGCFTLASLDTFGLALPVAAAVGVVVTTILRLLAVIFDISLPEQRALYRNKVAVETTTIPIVRPQQSPEGSAAPYKRRPRGWSRRG